MASFNIYGIYFLINHAFSRTTSFKNGSHSRFLTFREHIRGALKHACDHDSETLHLAKAAKYVRRDMFKGSSTFDGCLNQSQSEIVPCSLLTLVNMLLCGSNIIDQRGADPKRSVAAVTISQLIMFNSLKQQRAANAAASQNTGTRHTRDK